MTRRKKMERIVGETRAATAAHLAEANKASRARRSPDEELVRAKGIASLRRMATRPRNGHSAKDSGAIGRAAIASNAKAVATEKERTLRVANAAEAYAADRLQREARAVPRRPKQEPLPIPTPERVKAYFSGSSKYEGPPVKVEVVLPEPKSASGKRKKAAPEKAA